MKATHLLVLMLLLAGGFGAARAVGAEEPAPPAAPSPALEPPADRASRPEAGPPQRARSKGIRTLDEITIEGEVAVPQVLFITARDRPRYEDRLHHRYLWGSLELGRATILPEHFSILF